MIIHVPRVLWTVARGLLRSQPGVGVANKPHTYTARANALLDIDQFMHMNNAAYAVHLELARWEMGAASGLLSECFRRNAAFIVAANVIRYKREVRPLMAFEIDSTLVAADNRQMYILQSVREPHGERKLLAGGLCRAVLRKGRDTISPIDVFRVSGADDAVLQTISSADAQKTQRDALARLEEMLSKDT